MFSVTGLQLKFLILIESHNIFHWKPAKRKMGVVLGQNLGQISTDFSIRMYQKYDWLNETALDSLETWPYKKNIYLQN